MIKRTLATVLIILTVLPAMVLAGSVLFAPITEFERFDNLWDSSINAALGEGTAEQNACEPLPEENRFIVKFKEDVSFSLIENALDDVNYRQLAQSGQRLFVINDTNGEFIENYQDIIDYSEPDLVREILATTDDPATMPAYEKTGIYETWNTVKGRSDVIVAVLDTGVDRTHEDLADVNILPGFDASTKTVGIYEDTVGHGTGVIGIIAATADNGKGIAGAAHGVTILPIKVSSNSTTIYSSDLVTAIRFAANSGAKVINMSVGGLSYSYAEQEAVNYAVSKGCILVSASGNGGNLPYADKKSYPASYDGVISVASCTLNGERSEFSQYNDMVDVAAPGELITMPIVENGVSAYRTDSGTSYSCAIVSSIAALLVSASDGQARFNSEEFLALIIDTCDSTRTDELGYGIINSIPMVESINLPIITGVTDGGVYTESINVGFNRGSAMLDGEPFEDGDAIIANGRHVITVIDGDNERTVGFRLNYDPLSYKFREFSDYAYFEFNRGNALLDGFPYFSESKITSPGRHEFVLTDGSESLRETIVIQYTVPTVYGIEDGGLYDHPIEICITGDGTAFLNGKEFFGKTVVAESGQHILTVKSGNGAVSKNYTFEIDFPYAEIIETDYAEALAAIDEENGFVCLYGDSLVGVRIYDINDMSQYMYFLPIGQVYAHNFTENELILAGENGITIIARKNAFDPETAIIKTVNSAQMHLYVFAEDDIYCFDKQNIYLYDLPSNTVVHQARIGFECEVALYSDGLLCLMEPSNNNSIHLFDLQNKRLKTISPNISLEWNSFYFGDGYLAIGNQLLDLSSETIVLEFESNKVLNIEDGILYCENSIFDISSGKKLGNFPFTISQFVKGFDSLYLFGIEPILAKISNEAQGIYAFGAATPTDFAFSAPETSNKFTQTLFIDNNNPVISAVANDLNTFAIFKDKYTLYSFSLEDLSENTPVTLLYEPSELYLSNGYLVVSFANVPFVYVAPDSNISSGRYIELPAKSTAACTVNGVVYTISGGRLTYFNVDGSDAVVSSVRANAIATDGTRIYVLNGTNLSVYNENFKQIAETITNGGQLFVANGVIVGGKVYDATLVAEYAVISNNIFYAYNNIYFTKNKIYDILSSRLIGNLGIDNALAICANANGQIIAFDKDYIIVSQYADASDNLSSPIIEGISEGGIYNGKVTVAFNEGVGHIDGKIIESGSEITKAGAHTFVLSLPFGQSISINFTIEANIEKIEFLVPNRTMSVGETITLRVKFLPVGASSVPVTYSCDKEGLVFGEMGEVTAVRKGIYAVTATVKTDYGTFVATNTITVSDDLINFIPESELYIDRDNLLLFGVTPGSKASNILSQLSTKKEAKVLNHLGREVEGVLATGHKLSLYDENGKITDTLTIVIRGDTDGDGYITAYDMFVLERILRNYSYSYEFVAAGDINQNGVLADNDFRELRNILLRRNDTPIGTPDKNLFGSITIQTLSHISNDDIIDVAICLNGSKYARGINGVIEYSDGLEFVESTNTGWEGTCRDIGNNRLGFFAHGDKGEECGKAFFVLINLRFRVTANANEYVSISTKNVTAAFESGAKSINFEDGEFLVRERKTGNFGIEIFNANGFEFDPNTYEYNDITIPYNNALADIAITREENSKIEISSLVVPEKGTTTITVEVVGANGNDKVYSLNIRRESEPRFDSNCKLESLEIEGFKLMPIFDPNITEYSISVPFGTEKINLHCIAQNPTAQVVIGDTTIRDGQNSVTVTVSAPDGESLVYTIYVTVLPEQEESSSLTDEPNLSDESNIVWEIFGIATLVLFVITIATVIVKKHKRQK